MGSTGLVDPPDYRHAHVQLRLYKLNNDGTIDKSSRKDVRWFNILDYIFDGYKIWKK